MKARIIFLLILGVLLVTGCTGQPSPTVFQPTDTLLPTTSPGMTRTATLAQTIASTHTPRPSPSPSDTSTPVPLTWTPLPTLPPDEAQKLVIELIKTNGNCALPCWWGITPGVTSWEKARSFLETFATQILTLNENLYGVTYDNLPESISRGAVGATLSVDNGIVQTIRTDVFYSLAEMLQTYGQPNEIWIYASPQSIIPKATFTIALFYSDQGILANYIGTAENEEIFRICPNEINDGQGAWFLWNPLLNFTFKKIGTESGLFAYLSEMFLLEDATGMDEKAFYETYKDPESASVCIKMPNPTR